MVELNARVDTRVLLVLLELLFFLSCFFSSSFFLLLLILLRFAHLTWHLAFSTFQCWVKWRKNKKILRERWIHSSENTCMYHRPMNCWQERTGCSSCTSCGGSSGTAGESEIRIDERETLRISLRVCVCVWPHLLFVLTFHMPALSPIHLHRLREGPLNGWINSTLSQVRF